MLRLVSYIKNPIDYAANGREYILVDGLGPLKAAFKGRGVIYSWFQGVGRTASLNCQFELQQTTIAEYFTDESGKIHLGVEPRVPCSGLVTSTGEGFLICPAYKLEPIKGQNISFLILEPRTSPYSLAVEKTVLSIPTEESELTITSDAGKLLCTGIISSKSKTAHIILNRNPELPRLQSWIQSNTVAAQWARPDPGDLETHHQNLRKDASRLLSIFYGVLRDRHGLR